jgi:hypothetical protein
MVMLVESLAYNEHYMDEIIASGNEKLIKQNQTSAWKEATLASGASADEKSRHCE